MMISNCSLITFSCVDLSRNTSWLSIQKLIPLRSSDGSESIRLLDSTDAIQTVLVAAILLVQKLMLCTVTHREQAIKLAVRNFRFRWLSVFPVIVGFVIEVGEQ